MVNGKSYLPRQAGRLSLKLSVAQLLFTIYDLPFTIHGCSSSAGLRNCSLLSCSHFSLASPVRSLGSVSTGMLWSAQNLRQRTKRASNCPVPSEISFDTFGFSSDTDLAPRSFRFFSLPDSFAEASMKAERCTRN